MRPRDVAGNRQPEADAGRLLRKDVSALHEPIEDPLSLLRGGEAGPAVGDALEGAAVGLPGVTVGDALLGAAVGTAVGAAVG